MRQQEFEVKKKKIQKKKKKKKSKTETETEKSINQQNAIDAIIYFVVFNTLFVLYVLEPISFQERFIWAVWFALIAFVKYFTIVTKERVGLV